MKKKLQFLTLMFSIYNTEYIFTSANPENPPNTPSQNQSDPNCSSIEIQGISVWQEFTGTYYPSANYAILNDKSGLIAPFCFVGNSKTNTNAVAFAQYSNITLYGISLIPNPAKPEQNINSIPIVNISSYIGVPSNSNLSCIYNQPMKTALFTLSSAYGQQFKQWNCTNIIETCGDPSTNYDEPKGFPKTGDIIYFGTFQNPNPLYYLLTTTGVQKQCQYIKIYGKAN